MKRMMVLVVAVLVIAMAGMAMAADTNTLTVTAAVGGTCKFSTPTSTLAFGILDPSALTDGAATTTTQFWCTKGVTTDVIAAGNGANWSGTKRQMLDTVSTDLIPYTLTLTKDALANLGPASPRTLTIVGAVLNADYTAKTAGNYSDTVALTITP